ncbi:MAG: SIS domain-containing protein [Peptococcaceae bacterium]|nr:SIS domain-containing protein [Peptococcaceae bacterium]
MGGFDRWDGVRKPGDGALQTGRETLNENTRKLLERFYEVNPDLAVCAADIERACETLIGCYRERGKALLCGNGGSAADCEHMAGELMKGFLRRRGLPDGEKARFKRLYGSAGETLATRLQGALPAISLTGQSALLTACANDIGSEFVFAQQVYGYGRPGDVLVAVSTSGHSANVLQAMRTAGFMDMTVIGLTGSAPSEFDGLCHVVVKAPAEDAFRVQEYHLPIYHLLCAAAESEFFDE